MKIYSRKRWNPKGSRGEYDHSPKRELFIHHSVFGNASIDTFAEQCAAMRQIDQMHLNNGWSGLGYSFVVFQPYGRLRRARTFEGRGWDYIPAAQLSHNTGTIAVCVVGNFNTQKVKLSTRWEIVRIGRIARKRGIRTIGGHRDVFATECPGNHLYDLLNWFSKRTGLRRFKRS